MGTSVIWHSRILKGNQITNTHILCSQSTHTTRDQKHQHMSLILPVLCFATVWYGGLSDISEGNRSDGSTLALTWTLVIVLWQRPHMICLCWFSFNSSYIWGGTRFTSPFLFFYKYLNSVFFFTADRIGHKSSWSDEYTCIPEQQSTH